MAGWWRGRSKIRRFWQKKRAAKRLRVAKPMLGERQFDGAQREITEVRARDTAPHTSAAYQKRAS